MCMKDAMAIDARGGMACPARATGQPDAATRERIGLDGPPRQYVGAMCTSASELAM